MTVWPSRSDCLTPRLSQRPVLSSSPALLSAADRRLDAASAHHLPAAAVSLSPSRRLPAALTPSRPAASLLPTPCPVVAGMGDGAVGRWFYQPHWPEHAVVETLKRGIAFMGKFRVNAHNRNEAYCTIYGIPGDVLITEAAQNRAATFDFKALHHGQFGIQHSKNCHMSVSSSRSYAATAVQHTLCHHGIRT